MAKRAKRPSCLLAVLPHVWGYRDDTDIYFEPAKDNPRQLNLLKGSRIGWGAWNNFYGVKREVPREKT